MYVPLRSTAYVLTQGDKLIQYTTNQKCCRLIRPCLRVYQVTALSSCISGTLLRFVLESTCRCGGGGGGGTVGESLGQTPH